MNLEQLQGNAQAITLSNEVKHMRNHPGFSKILETICRPFKYVDYLYFIFKYQVGISHIFHISAGFVVPKKAQPAYALHDTA